MCLKLIDIINNFYRINQNEDENFHNIISFNRFNSPIFKNNNYLISNTSSMFPNVEEIDKNLDLISSFTKNEKNFIFDIDKLEICKNISFEYNSIYKNINIISNGKYEKNKIMQKDTEEFILSSSKEIINNLNKIFNYKNN